MKVKTLIAKLEKMDPEANVVIYDFNSEPIKQILESVEEKGKKVCLITRSKKPKRSASHNKNSDNTSIDSLFGMSFTDFFESVFGPDNKGGDKK